MRVKMAFRLLAIAALFTLVIPLAADTPTASASGGGQFPIPEKTALKYPNLGSTLDQLAARVEEGAASAQEAAKDAPLHREDSVAVTIYLSGNVAGVVSFLEDNGGSPRNMGGDYIEAYVPVTLLGQVSEQPGVLRVREIIPPQPAYGDITSQGVQAHLSEAWNQAGFSGQDIKVGVIDVGFEGFGGLGGIELPSTVVSRCYTDVGIYTRNLADCEDGGVHGTEVSETVMDIAPEVSLYISQPISPGDLQSTVNWMVSEGVTVINYSVGWTFDGPGDGTSPYYNSPLKTVDRAVDGGILWVNAAGNDAQETWFGDYFNPEGDKWINFSKSDELNTISLREGDVVYVQLRWEGVWGKEGTDLGLYLFDSDGNLVSYSDDYQSGPLASDFPTPYEFIGYEVPSDGDYFLVIYHDSGPAPGWIQLMGWYTGALEHHTRSGSITNPAESANPGMLAAGAAPWFDVDTIEPYSSQGPAPDGRVKPDIVGADCGETVFYTEQRRRPGCWFSGTSQAAPHVAGMAALVRQRFPSWSTARVAGYLKESAEQREMPDPNNTWGHGFAQLPPIDQIVFAGLNWDSAELQNHIVRYIVENGYGRPTGLASGATVPLLQALRDGGVDVMMEVWLPNLSDAWEPALEAGEVLDLGGSLGTDWQSAFVIPAYLQEQYPELDSVEDLKEQQYKDLFKTAETGGKARLVSCVIGWACEGINARQIKGYGLGGHVEIINPGNGPALDADLYDAYERQEPWLGYQWGTNDPALTLDLVRLAEPAYSGQCWRTTMACAYEDSTILVGANSRLPEAAPEVVKFLRQWDFNANVHLRNAVRWRDANPQAWLEDTALWWLGNNIDYWSGWVTAEAAAGVRAALPSPPGAPSITAPITVGPDAMTVGWSGPSDTGGARIIAYDLRYIETGATGQSGANWTLVEDVWIADPGSLQYVLTGLTGSTVYSVQVRGVNAAGEGAWSPIAEVITAPPAVPSAPRNLTAEVVAGKAQVILSWAAPSSSGGAAITGYRIESRDLDSDPWTEVYTTDGDATGYTDNGADSNGPIFGADVTRHYRVSAINSAGTGSASNVAIATTDVCLTPLGALDGPVNRTGSWDNDCGSRYYSFILSSETTVEIDLNAVGAGDPLLNLREWQGRNGNEVASNDNVGRGNLDSAITTTLAAGGYTVEATTPGGGSSGSFTLSVRPQKCAEDLGMLTAGVNRNGVNWIERCLAPTGTQDGSYARTYDFTLGQDTALTIDLVSDLDPILFVLRHLNGWGWTVAASNDDVDFDRGNINSQIDRTFTAGTYTIVAAPFAAGFTDTFNLTISIPESGS